MIPPTFHTSYGPERWCPCPTCKTNMQEMPSTETSATDQCIQNFICWECRQPYYISNQKMYASHQPSTLCIFCEKRCFEKFLLSATYGSHNWYCHPCQAGFEQTTQGDNITWIFHTYKGKQFALKITKKRTELVAVNEVDFDWEAPVLVGNMDSISTVTELSNQLMSPQRFRDNLPIWLTFL